MCGKTHKSVALLLAIPFITMQSLLVTIIEFLVVLISSTLPDIDMKIGLKHRTITHSLLFFGFVSIFVLQLLGSNILLFFSIGILSHIFLDTLTKSGVPIFYPFSLKSFGIRKITTNSPIDKAIGAMALLCIIYIVANKLNII